MTQELLRRGLTKHYDDEKNKEVIKKGSRTLRMIIGSKSLGRMNKKK